MTNPVYSLASGAQASDGTVATTRISTNQTVTATNSPIAILTDVVSLPGPTVTGNFVTASSRVSIRGVPIITSSSQGVCFSAAPAPTSPLTVMRPDSRVSAQ